MQASLLSGQHLSGSPPLVAVVALAAGGSLVLVAFAVAALARRRSWSYLLVAGALLAVAARSAVVGLSLGGVVDGSTHHLVEHGLDAVMAGLVIAAVYHARTVESSVRPES